MLTILLRSVLVYVLLIFAVRLMGKRQIGELEISDFVTTLLISEIASLPITDHNIPISHAVIPIIVLIFFEVVSSVLVIFFPKMKGLLTARPATLIREGQICEKEMLRARISMDELISELRQKDVTDLSEVLYAILEQNGKISVVPKNDFRPITRRDLGIHKPEEGIYHITINRGVWNQHGLNCLNLSDSELRAWMVKESLSEKEILLMMINDQGKIQVIKKESAP